jgi:hypothetical protein
VITLAELAAATPSDAPAPSKNSRIRKPGWKPRHSKRMGPHKITRWLRAHPSVEFLASSIARAVNLDKSRVANHCKRHPDEIERRYTRVLCDGKRRRVALYRAVGV